MDDAWVRVNRAEANFKALKDAIGDFARDHPDTNTVIAKHDGKGNVRLLASVKERPPRDWGLAAGDILVDLRCALDYAVYALAISTTQDPPPYADKLEFPILVDPKWSEAVGRKKVENVPAGAQTYIESIQPYQTGNGGTDSALFVLEELVGINKHRFIYVAWSRLHEIDFGMKWEGLEPTDFMVRHIPGELKDGAVLATFRLSATTKNAQFKMQPRISTFVAIEPTFRGWLDLLTFLGQIGPYVRHVIGELEDFLTPGHEGPSPSDPIRLRQW